MIDILQARFEDIEDLICQSGVVKNIIDSATVPVTLDITEMIGFQRGYPVDFGRGIIKRKHRHILSISLMITYRDIFKQRYQTIMMIQLPGRYVLGYDCDDTGRLTDSGRLLVSRSGVLGNKIVSLRKDEVSPYLRINDLLEMYRNEREYKVLY